MAEIVAGYAVHRDECPKASVHASCACNCQPTAILVHATFDAPVPEDVREGVRRAVRAARRAAVEMVLEQGL